MELGKLNYVKEHNLVVESVILAAAGYIRSIFGFLGVSGTPKERVPEGKHM